MSAAAEAHTGGPALRAVNGEAAILLGAGRALLLQLAHPLVARGVAEHSTFRRDRVGRLLRTLRPMYAIAFGTPEEVAAAARGVNAAHRRVVGPGYRALDPDLLLWVYATLVDTALVAHERFVGPLAPALAEAYYVDTKLFARLLGVPDEEVPHDLDAFRRYVAGTVAALEVSDTARALAADLFRPLPPLGPALLPLRFVTAGLLPPRIREGYGFGWGPAREATLEVFAAATRATVARLPRELRRPPALLMPSSVTGA